MAAADDSKKIKMVVQQCLKASLRLPDDCEAGIGRGMVVFVCFKQGAREEDAAKAAEVALAAKLCEVVGESKRVSVVDALGEVLVVPQATLGGKLKGKALQYHGNVNKDEGEALYAHFVATLSSRLAVVRSGSYGARQVLSLETNGPFTHTFAL